LNNEESKVGLDANKMEMTIVYWMNSDNTIMSKYFDDLNTMLNFNLSLRQTGARFIATATENVSCDMVRDGLLPNGQPYTWKKRRP